MWIEWIDLQFGATSHRCGDDEFRQQDITEALPHQAEEFRSRQFECICLETLPPEQYISTTNHIASKHAVLAVGMWSISEQGPIERWRHFTSSFVVS